MSRPGSDKWLNEKFEEVMSKTESSLPRGLSPDAHRTPFRSRGKL